MALNDDDDPVRTALQNELILQEIFNFLPLKSLLTSGLVSKLWNTETRTYIRDHRKCTAFISSPTVSPWDELQQLDQDLARMTNVPFNSLKIKLRRSHTEPEPGNSHRQWAPRSSHPENNIPRNFNKCDYKNLFSKVKLKHLCISLDENVITGTFLIFRLVTEKGTDLKSLSFDRISTLLTNLLSKTDKVEFPQLQHFEILNLQDWLDNNDKGLLQKMLEGAPMLEKISHDNGDWRILEILPESKYKLLNKFEFLGLRHERLNALSRKLVESGPRISELSASFAYDESDVPPICHSMFRTLVQSCLSCLKTLKVRGIRSCEKLEEFPPLLNVNSLTINIEEEKPLEFLDGLQLFRFGDLFPNLEKVSLQIYCARFTSHVPQCADEVDREFSSGSVLGLPYSCSTATNLNVNMEVCPLELLQLQRSFPNVVQLRITAGVYTSRTIPYQQIFRFWPDLKILDIRGEPHYVHILPNCDADFCGIHQEEVKLLWTMEEEYLRTVQIVPVRPCISTMKCNYNQSLRHGLLSKMLMLYVTCLFL